MKDYAKTKPEVTFINGTSAAQDTTLRDPAPNFFRFFDRRRAVDGRPRRLRSLQLEKGYKKVATVAEDYFLPLHPGGRRSFHGRGSASAGGTVPSKSWVPIGNKDCTLGHRGDPGRRRRDLRGPRRRRRRQLPDAVPAGRRRGAADPAARSPSTRTVLSSKGKIRDVVVGTPSAGPIADTNTAPEWVSFSRAPTRSRRARASSPSLFAHGYYVNTKAVPKALDEVGGDVSGGGAKFRDALSKLSFDTPKPARSRSRRQPQRHRRHLPHRGDRGRRAATSTNSSSGSCRRSARPSASRRTSSWRSARYSPRKPELPVSPTTPSKGAAASGRAGSQRRAYRPPTPSRSRLAGVSRALRRRWWRSPTSA